MGKVLSGSNSSTTFANALTNHGCRRIANILVHLLQSADQIPAYVVARASALPGDQNCAG
jgi:hypothetical protein